MKQSKYPLCTEAKAKQSGWDLISQLRSYWNFLLPVVCPLSSLSCDSPFVCSLLCTLRTSLLPVAFSWSSCSLFINKEHPRLIAHHYDFSS